MSRSLCLFLALVSLTHSFSLGNYYVGALPYRRKTFIFINTPFRKCITIRIPAGNCEKHDPKCKRLQAANCYSNPNCVLAIFRAATDFDATNHIYGLVKRKEDALSFPYCFPFHIADQSCAYGTSDHLSTLKMCAVDPQENMPNFGYKKKSTNMFMDSPYENRIAFGQWRGGRDFPVGDSALQKDKKDTLPMKRFKPCYYSPIQCLIKRR